MRARKVWLPLRALDSRPLLLFATLFGTGALLTRSGRMPLWLPLVCAGALLVVYGLLRLGGRRCAALLAAAGLFLGAARMTQAVISRPRVESRYSATISGVIADDPYVDAAENRLTCRLTGVRVAGERLDYDARLYLRGNDRALAEVRPGQTVTMEGHLWAPERATNPGEFDFSAYLWRNGMGAYVTAKLADATISGSAPGVAAWLYSARRAIGERIDALFPHSADLVRALVLGDRADMDEELRESFSRAGIAHVLSISGLHITFLALALMAFFRLLLPRGWAFLFSLVLIAGYGVLVGLKPPVLRAILMYATLGLGQTLGRPTDAATRLSLAFLALLVWNPLFLADAGFVLSFSAAAGMLCLTPPLTRLLRLDGFGSTEDEPRQGLVRRGARYYAALLCATLAAQLATLPAVLAFYGSLPLLATFANLLIVPLILAGMFSAVFALFLSVVWPPLGRVCALLPDGVLLLTAWAARRCANLPLSSLSIPAFPAWLTALYAIAAVTVSDMSRLGRRLRQWLLLALPALACVAFLLPLWNVPGLEIVFLDAGQADAAVVRAQGEVYLVDVGAADTPVADYLTCIGKTPRAVFLSHPHADHAGGLDALLEICVPETIYVPVGWDDAEADGGVRESVARAQSLGSTVIELAAGDEVRLSADVCATVLHPGRNREVGADVNSLSLLLQVEYGDASALFTGDLPMDAEPGPMPDADVLKVAHHGANGSSSYMALYSASPSVAVISVGRNSYGHPGRALLERLAGTGARVYRTDERGAITVQLLKNGGVRVRTFVVPEASL